MDVCRFRKRWDGFDKLSGDVDHEPMAMSLDRVKPRAQG